jgi:hypothetical protein
MRASAQQQRAAVSSMEGAAERSKFLSSTIDYKQHPNIFSL